MKKLLDFLLVILGVSLIVICYQIPDHKVYIASENIGNGLNMFGLIIGGLCTLFWLSTLSDKNLSATTGSSILLILIFILNWIFILLDFTVDTSSILSNHARDVSNMGMSVKSKVTNGAYYPIAVSVAIYILSLIREKISQNEVE